MSKFNMSDKITINRGLLWLMGGISPLSILGLMFYLGSLSKDIEGRIFVSSAQREKVISIALDRGYHTSYKEKIRDFVPRSEVEYIVNDLRNDIKDIKEALKIRNYETTRNNQE